MGEAALAHPVHEARCEDRKKRGHDPDHEHAAQPVAGLDEVIALRDCARLRLLELLRLMDADPIGGATLAGTLTSPGVSV